ncbi:nuclease-related domain-containing protein [Desulfoplanes formicivorans]|uniref:Nuclease n=1 Tax=Desulfoplanes formicivorans TaxID=1592317 RepID=A0A194AIE8_9BACT|nr:NERD domain-containing protein [Desulfoplanes formicivorans]GAU09857.1 nuclease [Desulfoplanes formicivorans]
MIIKRKDSIEPHITTLTSFLKAPGIPEETKQRIRNEIARMQQGFKGERACAFFLEGFVKDHPNRVLIHDLRIKDNGDVAQIDHLLINRNLGMFVLESKNYSHGFKIKENGEFEYWNGKFYCGMASPVEQAKRQMEILQRYLVSRDFFPKRLGITLRPQLDFFVLCAPNSRIIRPKHETDVSRKVVKADLFKNVYTETTASLSFVRDLKGAVNLVSKKTLIKIAQKIVQGHIPQQIDYRARFGITDEQLLGVQNVYEKQADYGKISLKQNHCDPPSCPKCGRPMVLRKATRGANAGNLFWGCSAFPQCRGIINVTSDSATP